MTQKDFDALKDVLVWASLLYPPNYQRDYFLYLIAVVTTIVMVLFREDDLRDEHPIYYLSWNISENEIEYSHFEKFALVVLQVVQKFDYYITLQKAMVISNCNPMTYIPSRQLLREKIL